MPSVNSGLLTETLAVSSSTQDGSLTACPPLFEEPFQDRGADIMILEPRLTQLPFIKRCNITTVRAQTLKPQSLNSNTSSAPCKVI